MVTWGQRMPARDRFAVIAEYGDIASGHAMTGSGERIVIRHMFLRHKVLARSTQLLAPPCRAVLG
jgi:hypothetical protein